MNAVERRKEIMRILNVRRHETMQVFASEFGVSEEETTVLEEMLSKADEHQSQILKQLLARFGPNTYRHCKA